MDAFFKWLAGNTNATNALILAFSALVLAIILIYVVSFFQGRSISFWPPRVGEKADSIKKRKKAEVPNIKGNETPAVSLKSNESPSIDLKDNESPVDLKTRVLPRNYIDGMINATRKRKPKSSLPHYGQIQLCSKPTAALRVWLGHSEGLWVFIGDEKAEITFGRCDTNIILDDDAVSSKHFKINVTVIKDEDGQTDYQFQLTDLDSTNGTFVNEERIEPYQSVILKHKDKIEVGYSVLNFHKFRTL